MKYQKVIAEIGYVLNSLSHKTIIFLIVTYVVQFACIITTSNIFVALFSSMEGYVNMKGKENQPSC